MAFFVASKCKLWTIQKSFEGAPTEKTGISWNLVLIRGGALTPKIHQKHIQDVQFAFLLFGEYSYICLVTKTNNPQKLKTW